MRPTGGSVLISAPFPNILRENALEASTIRFHIDARAVANVIFPLTKESAAIGLAQDAVPVTHVAEKLADV